MNHGVYHSSQVKGTPGEDFQLWYADMPAAIEGKGLSEEIKFLTFEYSVLVIMERKSWQGNGREI